MKRIASDDTVARKPMDGIQAGCSAHKRKVVILLDETEIKGSVGAVKTNSFRINEITHSRRNKAIYRIRYADLHNKKGENMPQ